MMVMENSKQRGLLYRALRAGFRAMPYPLRAALLEALNSETRRLKSLKRRAASSVSRQRCSVCNRRVNRFDPFTPEYKEEIRSYGYIYTFDDAETCNADAYTCHWCGASDRDRLYALYLRDYFRPVASTNPETDPIRIIDFAPTLPLSSFIKRLIADSPRKFSYRTADLFAEGVDDQVDIMDMKIYSDNSVDFFICSHILEHVTDDKKALAELYRILKREGQGILVVPIVLAAEEIDEDPSVTDVAERWRRFGQNDHVRLYSKDGFLTRVRQAGFTVRQLGQEHFGRNNFMKYGITERSVLYIVEKHD